jgi:hypothetical protein
MLVWAGTVWFAKEGQGLVVDAEYVEPKERRFHFFKYVRTTEEDMHVSLAMPLLISNGPSQGRL